MPYIFTRVDIIEHQENIIVIADMPGVDEKSVDITLEKNVLTIYGKVESDIHKDTGSPVGIWHRRLPEVFTLSDEVDRTRSGISKERCFKTCHAKGRAGQDKENTDYDLGLMNLN